MKAVHDLKNEEKEGTEILGMCCDHNDEELPEGELGRGAEGRYIKGECDKE